MERDRHPDRRCPRAGSGNLKPKVTARLEHITVFSGDGAKSNATFDGTLSDYGCFLAKLDQPLKGKAVLRTGSILDFRDQLLLKAEVEIQGENRIAYYNRDRITYYHTGWKRNMYPATSAAGEGGGSRYGSGGSAIKFLFATDGGVVALPIERRQKVTVESQYGESGPIMTSAMQLSAALADLKVNVDADNVPLTEDEENRLAWLGVELQPMDTELARANNVSSQTNDGQTGAIVTYIYPNSPASEAGIEMGDIILRMHVEGQPKPLEVSLEGFGGEGFPWQYLDRVPEDYFERLPKPWGSAETSLTRALTDVGFGKAFTAEVFRNGQLITKQFKVTQGPAHYDAAKRFKSEDLGITVRDLTYEVRRYFQIKENDPGVIISKIEKGSKAAVAGLKPYEIVLNVNDTPIRTTQDFEKAVTTSTAGELRLSIKRMTEGRIVKLKSAGGKSEPAAKPDGEPEGAPDRD